MPKKTKPLYSIRKALDEFGNYSEELAGNLLAAVANCEIPFNSMSAEFNIGNPWQAGREVWVFGLTSGKGRSLFRVARLHADARATARELRCLYAQWMKVGRTLTPDEAQTEMLACALSDSDVGDVIEMKTQR